MEEILFLCKNGVGNIDRVMEFDPAERFGMVVILARLEGLDFDFDAQRWSPRK